MNNDKLLRAFIEASGYEVEEVISEEQVWVGVYSGEEMTIPQKTIDYKVTKKVQSKQEVIKRMMVMMEESDISFEDIDQAYNWGPDDNT